MCKACGLRHNSLAQQSGSSGGSGDDGSIVSAASGNPGWGDSGSSASGRSMKEVEAQLATLQKENFDLKCRVYLMEHQGAVEQPGSQRLELELENESLRAALLQKQSLLQQAGAAFTQLEDAYRGQLQLLTQQLHEAREQLRQLQLSLEDSEERCRALRTERYGRSEDMSEAAGLAFPDFGDYSREGSLAPTEAFNENNFDVDACPTPSTTSSNNGTQDLPHYSNAAPQPSTAAPHHTTTPPVHINTSNVTYNSINNSVGTPQSPHHHSTTQHHYFPTPTNQASDSTTVVPASQDCLQQLAALQAALATERSERSTDRHTIASLSQQLEAVQPAISVKVAEVEERNAIIERTQEQLEHQNRVLVEIQITLDEKTRVIQELETSLAQARRDVAGLESSLESARNEVSGFGDIKIELERARKEVLELESARKELLDVESARKELESGLAEAKAHAEKLGKDYDKSCAALTGVMTELTAVKAQNKRLSRKNGELLRELRETVQMLGEGQAGGLAEEENERLWAELESAKSELEEEKRRSQEAAGHAQQLSELRDRLSALQEELKTKSEEEANLREELEARREKEAKTGEDAMTHAVRALGGLLEKSSVSVPVTVCVSAGQPSEGAPAPPQHLGGLERVWVSGDEGLQGLRVFLEEHRAALLQEWHRERADRDTAVAALRQCHKVRDALKQRLEDMALVLEQILESADELDLSRLSGVDVSCLQRTLDESRLLSQTLDASALADLTVDESFNVTANLDVSVTRADVVALVSGFYEELHRRINAILLISRSEEGLAKNLQQKTYGYTVPMLSNVETSKVESNEASVTEVSKCSTSCQTDVAISARPCPLSLGQLSAARLSSLIDPSKDHESVITTVSERECETGEETQACRATVSLSERKHASLAHGSESEVWYSEPDLEVSLARMGQIIEPVSGSSESSGERVASRRYRCDGRCRVAGRLREVVAALKTEVAAMGGDLVAASPAAQLLEELRGLRQRLEESLAASDLARRQLEAAAGRAGPGLAGLCWALLSAQDTAQMLRERLALAECCDKLSQREQPATKEQREQATEESQRIEPPVEESSFSGHEKMFAAEENEGPETTTEEEQRTQAAEEAKRRLEAEAQVQRLRRDLGESEEQVLRANRAQLTLLQEKERLSSLLLSVQAQTSLLCQSLALEQPPHSPAGAPHSPARAAPELCQRLLQVQSAVKELQRSRQELELSHALARSEASQELRGLKEAHAGLLEEFEELRRKCGVLTEEELLSRKKLEALDGQKRKEFEDARVKFEENITSLNQTMKALEAKHSKELQDCRQKESRLIEELKACEQREKTFKERLNQLEERSVEECRRLEERVRELGEKRLSLHDDSSSDRGLGSSVERLAPSSPRCAVLEHRSLTAEVSRLEEELQHARASLTEARSALARERGAKKSADKLICKELLKTYKVLDSTGKRAQSGSKATEERLKVALSKAKGAEKSQDVLMPRNKIEESRTPSISRSGRHSRARSHSKEN